MSDEPINVDMSSPIPRRLPTIYANIPESDADGMNESVSRYICVTQMVNEDWLVDARVGRPWGTQRCFVVAVLWDFMGPGTAWKGHYWRLKSRGRENCHCCGCGSVYLVSKENFFPKKRKFNTKEQNFGFPLWTQKKKKKERYTTLIKEMFISRMSCLSIITYTFNAIPVKTQQADS